MPTERHYLKTKIKKGTTSKPRLKKYLSIASKATILKGEKSRSHPGIKKQEMLFLDILRSPFSLLKNQPEKTPLPLSNYHPVKVLTIQVCD